jgi:hypothetical protein
VNILIKAKNELVENELGNHIFKPSAIFRKTYVEGFFCPECNTTLLRAENLEFITRNEEYWKCWECDLEMHISDNGFEIIFCAIKNSAEGNAILECANQKTDLDTCPVEQMSM